jgi:hypothetical protein
VKNNNKTTTENTNCLLSKEINNLFGDDKNLIVDNNSIENNELSDHIQFLITEVSGPKTPKNNVEEKEPPDDFELVATGKENLSGLFALNWFLNNTLRVCLCLYVCVWKKLKTPFTKCYSFEIIGKFKKKKENGK